MCEIVSAMAIRARFVAQTEQSDTIVSCKTLSISIPTQRHSIPVDLRPVLLPYGESMLELNSTDLTIEVTFEDGAVGNFTISANAHPTRNTVKAIQYLDQICQERVAPYITDDSRFFDVDYELSLDARARDEKHDLRMRRTWRRPVINT